MKLTEAFKALDALNEDTFSVSDDGISKLAAFEQNDDLVDEISVIDPEAETEEDIKDSYVGKVILDCKVCHSKLYKDAEEIELDEEQTSANVGEECPYCYTTDGFDIIGQVATFGGKFEEEEAPVDDETKTDDNEDVDDTADDKVDENLTEGIDEAVATLERPMSALGGTLSNVMTAHKDELSQVQDRHSAIEFLDSIGPEVKNKRYLASIKDKVARIPDSRAAMFLYNIILKGDGMGRENESLNKSKSIKEDVEVIYQKGNKKIIKDGYGYAIDDGINANRFYVTDDGEPKFDDGCSSKFWLDKVNSLIKAGKLTSRKNESKSIKEDVNNVNVETDDSIVNVNTDDNGKVTVTTEPKVSDNEPNNEVIVPVTDETQTTIENGVESVEDEFVDAEFDGFDEEAFDGLGESYLKNVYSNVDSYKTEKVTVNDSNVIVEGMIKFASGNEKKTSFMFEAKDCTKSGKYRFIGENQQLTRGKKAFTITGELKDKKFITESFNYNYKSKDTNGKSNRIYGTLKNRKG